MASVFKRGGRGKYLIHYYDAQGKRRERSSRTTDKRAAERIAAAIEAEVELRKQGLVDVRQEHLAKQARRSLAEHTEDFIQSKRDAGRSPRTVQDAERLLGWLADVTKAERLDELTTDAIAGALRQLKAEGRAARTHNHHLTLASGFLRWCVKMGRLDHNPADPISPLNEQRDRRRVRRALTEEEVERLLGAAEQRGRKAWYLVALLAGLRRGELGRIKWADVDLEAGVMTIREGKAKRTDQVPLNSVVVEALIEHKPPLVHPTAKVFPKSVTNATRTRDFARAGIELVDAEGRHADLHALRTTLGTMLARDGVAPQIAKQVMRHSDYRTTLKSYTALNLTDSRQAVEGLNIRVTPGGQAVGTPADSPADSPAVPAQERAGSCDLVQPDRMASGAETAWIPNVKPENGTLGVANMARPPGLEPGTAGLEIRCSIQLSYGRSGSD